MKELNIGEQVTNLENWEVHKIFTNPNNGYYGATFINHKNHHIILAHRGAVVIDGMRDIVWKDSILEANIAMLFNAFVIQQFEAYQATNETVQLAQDKNYSLSVTGYHLGAWLAEQSVYFSRMDFHFDNIKGVTFESPGSNDLLGSVDI